MKEVYLITGNKIKKKIAEENLKKFNIKVYNIDLKDDFLFQEPQMWNVSDIALYSAEYACKKLQKPVITSDVGYYFDCFKFGFPGPYIKWFNEGLEAQDIINLLRDKKDRGVTIRESLAYVDLYGNKKIVEISARGTISESYHGNGTSINKVLVLEGMNKVMGLYSQEELIKYWSFRSMKYNELGKYILNLKF